MLMVIDGITFITEFVNRLFARNLPTRHVLFRGIQSFQHDPSRGSHHQAYSLTANGQRDSLNATLTRPSATDYKCPSYDGSAPHLRPRMTTPSEDNCPAEVTESQVIAATNGAGMWVNCVKRSAGPNGAGLRLRSDERQAAVKALGVLGGTQVKHLAEVDKSTGVVDAVEQIDQLLIRYPIESDFDRTAFLPGCRTAPVASHRTPGTKFQVFDRFVDFGEQVELTGLCNPGLDGFLLFSVAFYGSLKNLCEIEPLSGLRHLFDGLFVRLVRPLRNSVRSNHSDADRAENKHHTFARL